MALEAIPGVTIITPVYNGARYLPDLIRSVQGQDYPAIEHLVIDDGSTDQGATIDVLRRYRHLRWWTRPNIGQYATINEGLRAARGEFVMIVSADDMLVAPSAISRAMARFLGRPEVNVVYGRTVRVGSTGNVLPRQPWQPPVTKWFGPRLSHWFLRHHLYICHCSMLVRRAFIVETNTYWDPELRGVGDWDWIVRLSQLSPRFGFVDADLSLYRAHAEQLSVTQRKGMHREGRRMCERHSANYAIYLFLQRLMYSYAPRLSALFPGRSLIPAERH